MIKKEDCVDDDQQVNVSIQEKEDENESGEESKFFCLYHAKTIS